MDITDEIGRFFSVNQVEVPHLPRPRHPAYNEYERNREDMERLCYGQLPILDSRRTSQWWTEMEHLDGVLLSFNTTRTQALDKKNNAMELDAGTQLERMMRTSILDESFYYWDFLLYFFLCGDGAKTM